MTRKGESHRWYFRSLFVVILLQLAFTLFLRQRRLTSKPLDGVREAVTAGRTRGCSTSQHLQHSRRQRLRRAQLQQSVTSPKTTFRICSKLMHPQASQQYTLRSASNIWRAHFDKILQASIHPHDVHQTHANWTHQLLDTLTPHILQRGIRTSPYNPSWANVLHKLSTRYHHLLKPATANDTNEFHPPLQVIVFGGSVTLGRDCHAFPKDVQPFLPKHKASPSTIRDQNCSWVFRLQHMIDTIVGKDIVQIHNLAAGGTDTQCALPLLQYQLYNEDDPERKLLVQHGPDLIINAYSANDNSIEFCHPIETQCLTSRSHSYTQDFTTASLSSTRSCQPLDQRPVVVYLDDYVGRFWNSIPIELQHHVVVQEEHAYRDMVGHVSSISALSHVFDWSRSRGHRLLAPTFTHPAHFGMPGHMARTWMMAFALLQWTVDFCQDEEIQQHRAQQPYVQRDLSLYVDNDTIRDSSNPIQSAVAVAESLAFKAPPRGWMIVASPSSRGTSDFCVSTPPLQPQLQFGNITFEWKRNFYLQQHDNDLICSSADVLVNNNGANWLHDDLNKTSFDTTASAHRTRAQQFQSPCSFAFVAGPAGTHTHPQGLRQYLYRYMDRRSRGWEVEIEYKHGFANNLGWVAHDVNVSGAILRVTNLTKPIQVITMHYLKSYGEKWMDSLANFSFFIYRSERGDSDRSSIPMVPTFITSWELSGYHDHNTSVSQVHRVDIGAEHAAQVGDTVELHLNLRGGTNFKLQSLMMCFR